MNDVIFVVLHLAQGLLVKKRKEAKDESRNEEGYCRLWADGAGRGADALVVGWNASGHYNTCVRYGSERRRVDADR